jgi:exonuclease SbcC
MKILKIRFENINSLKGLHEIDFTQKPLASSGLFAITGPTGSGKSTILDVITLALFNRIPRISEKISKNIIEKTGRGSYTFVEPMFRDYLLREFFLGD